MSAWSVPSAKKRPTAQASPGDAAVRPSRELDSPGAGLAILDHLRPFHRKISVRPTPAVPGLTPAAHACEAEVTATAMRSLPGKAGLLERFHREPFQRRISGCIWPPLTLN